MCFSQKKQKNILKLSENYNSNPLKQTFFNVQINLISNKDFISRNYDKLQRLKENSSKSKILFSLDKKSQLSLKIKTPNNIDFNINNINNINQNNNNNDTSKNLFSLSMNNDSSKKKLNKANSLINLRNINIINNNINNNNIYNNNSNNNNNDIINDIKKITKHPLLDNNGLSKIKSLYLNLNDTTKPFNNNNNKLFDSFNITKIKTHKNKDNNDNNNNKNELKKFFFEYYNNDNISYKSNGRNTKKKSLNLFNELYKKIIYKSNHKNKNKNKILPSLKKTDKTSSSNDINMKKNFSFYKMKNILFENKGANALMTSGSFNDSFGEDNLDLNAEEIHFKAVKYYQDIKNSEKLIDI